MSAEEMSWWGTAPVYFALGMGAFLAILGWLGWDYVIWKGRFDGDPGADETAALEFMSDHHHERHVRERHRLVVPDGAPAIAKSLHIAATSGHAWRMGPAFTGVALVITFFIIGHVMRQLNLDSSSEPGGSLNDAVREMGGKFWVSAAGVAATLLYQIATRLQGESLRRAARDYVRRASPLIVDERTWEREIAEQRAEAMKRVLESRLDLIVENTRSLNETAELSAYRLTAVETVLRQHAGETRQSLDGNAAGIKSVADGIQDVLHASRAIYGASMNSHQLTEKNAASQAVWGQSVLTQLEVQVQATKAIDARLRVTREDVQSINEALQGGLAPLVVNVEKMAETVLGPRIDEFVQRLQRALGAELEEQIRPLREDIRGQSNGEQLKGVAKHLQAAFTGGASEATKAFQDTMQQLNDALPEMIGQLRTAALQAQEANKQAFEALASEAARSEARLGELQGVVEASVGSVRTVVDALVEHATDTLHRVASQTEGAVQTMADQTANATAGLVQRVDALTAQLASTQQASSREAVSQQKLASAEQREWVASLSAFNTELSGTVAWLRGEREAVKSLAAEVAVRADQLEAQRKAGAEAVTRAVGVGGVAERLLKELRQQVEDDHKTHADTRLQIAEIRTRREELEAALHRIASEVASVMARDLKAINEQMSTNAKLIREMADVVGDKLVVPLGDAAQELREAVDKLGKQVVTHGRTGGVAAGGPIR